MGLFDLVVDIVTSPIEVVKDVVTVGGLLTDRDESYSSERLEKIIEDLDDIFD